MTQMSPERLLYAIRPKSLLFATGGYLDAGAGARRARPAAAARKSFIAGIRRAAPRGSLPEVLVRLHVEPHREEREQQPEQQEQRDEYDHAGRRRVALGLDHDLVDAEAEPEQQRDQPEDVEENQRVEVPDHVLLPHSPPEA